MTSEEFFRLLRQGQIPEVIVLSGNEPFLIDRARKAVRSAVFGADKDDFNDNQFEAKGTSAEAVIEAAVTLPVFAARRLVTVKDIHQWPAAELDLLLSYVERPVPETCLLLTAEKLDSRRKSTQLLKKASAFVEFKPLAERELPGYISQYLRQHDFAMTSDALVLFCSMVSGSLHDVHSELEKLIVFLGERRLIDIAEVQAVVSRGRAENIFELGHAVGRGDAATALRVVARLTSCGEPPLRILTLLVRHFRQMWKVRELQAQRCPEKEIPAMAGVPYFAVGDLLKQGKRFSRVDFMAGFEMFLETDLAMKSSGADADALLESLILQLAARKR